MAVAERRRGRSAWAVLGVRRGASSGEIRRAYRASARRTHPDLGGSPAAFAEVGAAWEKLRARPEVGTSAWDHARGVRRLIERIDGADVKVDDRRRRTTFRCPGGTAILDDETVTFRFTGWNASCSLENEPWEDVDDAFFESFVELLEVDPEA